MHTVRHLLVPPFLVPASACGPLSFNLKMLDCSDPGTLPLDSGFDFSTLPMGEKFPRRIDHRAIARDLLP